MKRIPAGERELVETELVYLTERLMKLGLTIPETRTYLRERLSVSV